MQFATACTCGTHLATVPCPHSFVCWMSFLCWYYTVYCWLFMALDVDQFSYANHNATCMENYYWAITKLTAMAPSQHKRVLNNYFFRQCPVNFHQLRDWNRWYMTTDYNRKQGLQYYFQAKCLRVANVVGASKYVVAPQGAKQGSVDRCFRNPTALKTKLPWLWSFGKSFDQDADKCFCFRVPAWGKWQDKQRCLCSMYEQCTP